MYACTHEIGSDFSRWCTVQRIGQSFLATRPAALALRFANSSLPAHRTRGFSPLRIFIHRSKMSRLAAGDEIGRPDFPVRLTLCRIVDMKFREFLFYEVGLTEKKREAL